MQVDGSQRVYAIADEDLPRENEEKTSSVHFLRFEFEPSMIDAFRQGVPVALGIDLQSTPFGSTRSRPKFRSRSHGLQP